jgi:hypothetical protein
MEPKIEPTEAAERIQNDGTRKRKENRPTKKEEKTKPHKETKPRTTATKNKKDR